jgi:hypothetical protein
MELHYLPERDSLYTDIDHASQELDLMSLETVSQPAPTAKLA